MASEAIVYEVSTLLERLVRYRDLSLFWPFIFGLVNGSPIRNNQDAQQETENEENTHGERVILINPFTQGMVMIDGTWSLETLFSEMGMKDGQPPASRESIEAMPSVEIGEGEDGECAICLEEWETGGVAKEMPCKHKFHQNCIEKWLGIHGSCPVCRYEMPMDEKEVGKRDEENEGGGGERRRGGREVWVNFFFRGGAPNQALSGDSTDSSSSPRVDPEAES